MYGEAASAPTSPAPPPPAFPPVGLCARPVFPHLRVQNTPCALAQVGSGTPWDWGGEPEWGRKRKASCAVGAGCQGEGRGHMDTLVPILRSVKGQAGSSPKGPVCDHSRKEGVRALSRPGVPGWVRGPWARDKGEWVPGVRQIPGQRAELQCSLWPVLRARRTQDAGRPGGGGVAGQGRSPPGRAACVLFLNACVGLAFTHSASIY